MADSAASAPASALIEAVARGGLREVEKALASGVDANVIATVSVDGFHTRPTTALFEAAVAENAEVLNVLLAIEGIDVNARAGRFRHTPLSYACDTGSGKVVELLLAHANIDVNAGADGLGTPFSLACTKGHLDVIKQLLERDDVDFNAPSRQGYPPVAEAVRHDHEDVVRLLLADERVDVNKERDGPEGSVSALVLAVASGQHDVVSAMMDSGRVDFDGQDAKHGLIGLCKEDEATAEKMNKSLERYFLSRASLDDLEHASKVAKLRYAFDALDIERRGYLPPERLGDFAASVGTELEDAEIKEAVVALDVSKDGRVDFAEVVAYWTAE